MRLTRVGVFAGLLLLAGCSSYWVKPGAKEADFATARGDCLQRAYAEVRPAMARTAILDTPYDANADSRDRAVSACLGEKGWTLVERGS